VISLSDVRVTWYSSEPSGRETNRSAMNPLDVLENTSHSPSGDHAGPKANEPDMAMDETTEPVASMTSITPPDEVATRLPSGENRGESSAAVDVSAVD